MPTLLSLEDVHAQYITRYGIVWAVNGVSLDISDREIVGIVGESGCGKSTLARIMMMYVKPPLKLVSGRVFLEKIELSKHDISYLKKNVWGKLISLVPQSVMNALNPTSKVKDLVRDVMQSHNPDLTDEEAYELAAKRFNDLGLNIKSLELYPFELSGGMRQRVAIAIATLLNPKLLIADEPTSALDVSTQKVVLRLLKKLWVSGIVRSMVIITHDIAVVRQIATRIAVMYAGKIVEVGPLEEVIFKPLHPYTELLMYSILTPEPEVKKRGLVEIKGTPPDLRNPPKGCPFYDRCPHAKDVCKEKMPEPTKLGNRVVYCHLASKKG